MITAVKRANDVKFTIPLIDAALETRCRSIDRPIFGICYLIGIGRLCCKLGRLREQPGNVKKTKT